MKKKLEKGFILTLGVDAVHGTHEPTRNEMSIHCARGNIQVLSFPGRHLGGSVFVEVKDGSIVVARDLLGTVPIYYRAISGGGWACSDDLTTLKDLTPHISDVDQSCLANYALSLQLLDVSEKTVWKGISRVLPGERVRFSPGRVSRQTGDDIPFTKAGLTPQRLISGLRSELFGEVAPVALSRGTDSTLLAMLMAGRDGASAVTMSFPSFTDMDESGGVKRIAELLGMPCMPFVLRPEHTDVFQDAFIEAVPVLHSGVSHELLFFRWLSKLGHNKVNTGVGADQLCYTPFYWVLRQLLASWKLGALRWRSRSSSLFFCKEAATVWSSGANRFFPSHTRAKKQLDTVLPSWKHPDFESGSDVLAHISCMSKYSRLPGRNYLTHLVASRQWESMVIAIRMLSEKAGIQIQTPFLSEPLWRVALVAPSWQLAGFDGEMGGPWDKLPVRRAHDLLGLLPRPVAWRGKVATFDSFVRAAIFLPRHLKLIRELASDMVLARWSIVDEKKFQRVIWRLLSGSNTFPSEGIARVWSTLFTEYWIRRMSFE